MAVASAGPYASLHLAQDTCSRMCTQILGHVCWLMLRVAGVNRLTEQRGKRHVARRVRIQAGKASRVSTVTTGAEL